MPLSPADRAAARERRKARILAGSEDRLTRISSAGANPPTTSLTRATTLPAAVLAAKPPAVPAQQSTSPPAEPLEPPPAKLPSVPESAPITRTQTSDPGEETSAVRRRAPAIIKPELVSTPVTEAVVVPVTRNYAAMLSHALLLVGLVAVSVLVGSVAGPNCTHSSMLKTIVDLVPVPVLFGAMVIFSVGDSTSPPGEALAGGSLQMLQSMLGVSTLLRLATRVGQRMAVLLVGFMITSLWNQQL
eukprot:TRINITY_DN26840_c0_g1_i1.p1 TRINITY_DN26840_c0_g1~~TRINITY_DN26840_c0_g1_i1.p1  ORF type:complete len:245 (-),score=37.58 TRINITY_DN26840_c0_g1_i1:176-910(-)